MINPNPIGDTIYGRPSQPTGRSSAGTSNLERKENPRDLKNNALNLSTNPINNTMLDESSWRGEGVNTISDRLNFGGGKRVIEGPP